jgi:hypothetical protein
MRADMTVVGSAETTVVSRDASTAEKSVVLLAGLKVVLWDGK